MTRSSTPSYRPQMRISRGSLAKLADERLIEPPSGGREQDHPPTIRAERLDGREDGLRLHHHPRTPTEGFVVHLTMRIGRGVADVVDVDLEDAGTDRSPEEAFAERALEDGGEDREDVDAHRWRLARGAMASPHEEGTPSGVPSVRSGPWASHELHAERRHGRGGLAPQPRRDRQEAACHAANDRGPGAIPTDPARPGKARVLSFADAILDLVLRHLSRQHLRHLRLPMTAA